MLNMSPRNQWSTSILIGSVFLLSACSNLLYPTREAKPLNRFDITLARTLEKKLNAAGPSLTVYPVQTNNRYNSERMAYSQRPYDFAYYAQNEWADAPGSLFLPLLIASMENSNQFSAVVSSGSPAITDLALDSELLALIHQIQENNSKVLLSLRVQLIDLRQRQVIASQTFNIEEPAPENTPYGAVIASNLAVNRLLPAIQEFVKSALQ